MSASSSLEDTSTWTDDFFSAHAFWLFHNGISPYFFWLGASAEEV